MNSSLTTWILSVFGFIAASFVALIAYFALGMTTGVIAMCGWAPAWWCMIYLFLSPGIVLFGLYIGRRIFVWHRIKMNMPRVEPSH